MANTNELQKRLKSIKGIEKITQAMKMVATSRVKKFQNLALDSAPYTEYLQKIIKDLAVNASEITSPLFESSKTNTRVLYIVFGADSGMCGSFNANVMNKAMNRINSRIKAGHKVYVIAVGKKCVNFFTKLEKTQSLVKVVYKYSDFGANVNDDKYYEISKLAQDMFLEGKVDKVRIIYAKFKNAMSQIPTAVSYLPIDKYGELSGQLSDVGAEKETDYTGQIFNETTGKMLHHQIQKKSDLIFEPDVETILNKILPKYLNNVVYHSAIESMASEFGAKMTAMTAANQNAQDIIGELSREFNKIRQTSITNQLIDIVNGGNAQN